MTAASVFETTTRAVSQTTHHMRERRYITATQNNSYLLRLFKEQSLKATNRVTR